ncbi:MAG: ABC transporter ATP-binding protein [Nitriliruptoraceae bacterium]
MSAPPAPPASARAAWRLTWGLLGRERRRVVIGSLAGVVGTAAAVAVPALLGRVVDEVVVAGRDQLLVPLLAALVGLALVAGAAAATLEWRLGVAGERMLAHLRTDVLDRLQHRRLDRFERESAGHSVALVTSDVDAVADLVRTGVVRVLRATLLLIGTLVAMLALSWRLALVSAAAVPVLAAVGVWFHRRSSVAYRTYRREVAATTGALQQVLAGHRTLVSLGAVARAHVSAHAANRRQYAAIRRAYRIETVFFPAVELAQLGTLALVLAAGGALAADGVVSVGVVAAFVLYVAELFVPVAALSSIFDEIQSGGAALQRLAAAVGEPPAFAPPERPVPPPERAALHLDTVSFAYPTMTRTLDAVDLHLEPGASLALVGATGAGKSTLGKLVARLLDPDRGRVRLDEVDLRDVDPASLRRAIVLLPQEGHVFPGTLADNVRLAAPRAGEDEVVAALDAVGAHDLLVRLPDGLATRLGPGGAQLSVGEAQLLGLARAALLDPQVIVLDEATSALDPVTERRVAAALDRAVAGRTTVVIAHRLATAARCDRVAVVADGRIVELGTHTELLASAGAYAALWRAADPTAR